LAIGIWRKAKNQKLKPAVGYWYLAKGEKPKLKAAVGFWLLVIG
jgi:hypothetical protein